MKPELLAFLLDPATYGSMTDAVTHVETHISDVFLAGDTALKVKKAVRFPFVDFSTLERRRRMCERELEVNRRFAPELYEGVVAIGESDGAFNLRGAGRVIEYGVKMRRFEHADLWSRCAVEGRIGADDIARLMERLAVFHRAAELRPAWGSYAAIRGQLLRNAAEIPAGTHSPAVRSIALHLHAALTAQRKLIEARSHRCVKAIHGDLHLGNIAFYHGAPLPFDGVEFSAALGSGDVWSDAAFLIMDLQAHYRPTLANRAMNAYLEESDDFAGLPLLPIYTAHRALIRAKVDLLAPSGEPRRPDYKRCLQIAAEALRPRPLRIIAIGGLSGSGKTTLAQAIAQELDGVVVRTDVIRKYLVGLRPLDIAPESAYAPAISEAVYHGLIERAHAAAPRGGVIILDGVHREAAQRAAAERFARAVQAPFTGFWCEVPQALALRRVEERTHDASNAHRGVVERQYQDDYSAVSWHHLDTSGSLAANAAHVIAAAVRGEAAPEAEACGLIR